MKLEIEIDSYYEASFVLGTEYKNHPEIDWDRIAINNMLNKSLKESNLLETNKDYMLSVRKATYNELDPDLEGCIKYTIRLRPITKLEILKNKGE